MRILHCGKFSPLLPGGMESFLLDLSAAQARAEDEVLILAHAASEEPGSRQETGNPRVWLARTPWTVSY